MASGSLGLLRACSGSVPLLLCGLVWGRGGQLTNQPPGQLYCSDEIIFVAGTCVIFGHTRCPLLISDGQFFTWGKNSHGQLGLGKEFPSQASPQRVRSLEGIPLAQVAAGGAHSFALSLSGAVFGWGMNNAGQLGLSDEEGT